MVSKDWQHGTRRHLKLNKVMNLTKIVSKDELRPTMCCAVLLNGYFYATDAHTGIRIKADTVPYFKVNTDHKVFDLNALKILAKGKEVLFEEDYFVITKGLIEGKFYYSGTIDKESKRFEMDSYSISKHAGDMKYPELEKILQDSVNSDSVSLPIFGINYKLLNNIGDSFIYDGHARNLKFKFTGKERAILVNPSEEHSIDQVGIIMPVMLNK